MPVLTLKEPRKCQKQLSNLHTPLSPCPIDYRNVIKVKEYCLPNCLNVVVTAAAAAAVIVVVILISTCIVAVLFLLVVLLLLFHYRYVDCY